MTAENGGKRAKGKGKRTARLTWRAALFPFPFSLFPLFVLCVAAPAAAQVAIHPATTTPAEWTRFAVRVVNVNDSPVVAVRVEVPDAVTVLGVEPRAEWPFRIVAATEATPQAIEWRGGWVEEREFQEFVFLGRVQGDVRQRDLVFPVTLTRAGGERLAWSGSPGDPRPAPRVAIVSPTRLSVRGAMALSGGAIAIAVIALALAVAARRFNPRTPPPRR